MSRIFITGDTHGDIDIHKLTTTGFPAQKTLTKEDYLIITGDFGLVWDNSASEKWYVNWLENKNFTTLFCDGNHENFNILNDYPVSTWNGGKVHFITPSIIHLMRGEIYIIGNYKFFVFGGAQSQDQHNRKENISWWPAEMPTTNEMQYGIDKLNIEGKVDFIITHESPHSTISAKCTYIDSNPMSKFLDFVKNNYEFGNWYFGHHHLDFDDGKFHARYDSITEI